jgi:Flp pilus assembly pilin Flp
VTDLFRQYCKNESGATAIEYALCAGIMMAALVAVAGTGGAVDTLYEKLMKISAAM